MKAMITDLIYKQSKSKSQTILIVFFCNPKWWQKESSGLSDNFFLLLEVMTKLALKQNMVVVFSYCNPKEDRKTSTKKTL